MQINVNGRTEVKDGERFRALLASKNPHDVSDKIGRQLVKDGMAEEVKQASTAKAGSQSKDGEE